MRTMTRMERIIDKIKVVLQDGKTIKVSDADVATALSISPQSLSNFKTTLTNIPTENINQFCAGRNISINWMIYDQITSSLEDPTMRYVGLTYIPDVNGSCGGGCTFADISEYEIARFPWYMVEFLKETSKLDNIHIINVIGDSMEPKLYDKDKVFVDTSKTEINDKDMFVVSTPDGIFIKMITVKENKITLVSLNDLYFNEEIDYEIKILGTVVGKI